MAYEQKRAYFSKIRAIRRLSLRPKQHANSNVFGEIKAKKKKNLKKGIACWHPKQQEPKISPG